MVYDRGLSAACIALIIGSGAAYDRPERFILATSPKTHNVLFAPMPTFHELTLPREDRPVAPSQILIDGVASKCSGWTCSENSDRGLEEPTGLALWQKGGGPGKLYVSDTKVGYLYRYSVHLNWRGFPEAGPQELVANDLQGKAHWLALDGYGNLFYTDSQDGSVSMIGVDELSKETPKSRILFSASKITSVAGPAGLAADSLNVYWANLKGDARTGTLVQASSSNDQAPKVLAGQTDMYQALAKDVCLARDNVFFTGESEALFAVKADGSSQVTEVSQNFKQPKGCVYDQEATVYVADSGDNAVYSLPANFQTLRKVRHVNKVASMPSPNQLVMFFGPSSNPYVQRLAAASGTTSAGVSLCAVLSVLSVLMSAMQ
eukprot:TRINITY_DN47741_c0_g1_i1.p1 TRINITY_DN47741_c0_g1~~TRINITY_DN47741_c0_g1_i1.p1  ORF type:complete len:376 (-),score=70.43 TRINITY_DN47741_c0_g1_i1:66-1193(-)